MNSVTLTETLAIDAGGIALYGDLAVPDDAACFVVFAHGGGNGRNSPRNQEVAEALNHGRCATLLVDLLTPEEEAAVDVVSARLHFDVEMLGQRLGDATAWLQGFAAVDGLPVGYFGASTGAGAALVAAASAPGRVGAVVSRGGRPDLAGSALPRVEAPTLLIAGGADPVVVRLNRDALGRIAAPSDLAVVPHASHLFEEPGALDTVAQLALEWFERHLLGAGVPRPE